MTRKPYPRPPDRLCHSPFATCKPSLPYQTSKGRTLDAKPRRCAKYLPHREHLGICAPPMLRRILKILHDLTVLWHANSLGIRQLGECRRFNIHRRKLPYPKLAVLAHVIALPNLKRSHFCDQRVAMFMAPLGYGTGIEWEPH